jgi:hypothetical protein
MRSTLPMQRILIMPLLTAAKVITYSMGPPISICDSDVNRTPPELMFLVFPGVETRSAPERITSTGRYKSNRFDCRCSVTFNLNLLVSRV